ncbi:MAG TPA: response regulator transcription factor [Gaiellaceae bacterium]
MASRPTLLFVGDRSAFEGLSRVLRRVGYTVVHAGTALAALAAVRTQQPVVVGIELDLVGISAYELCHELRQEHGQALPIVLVCPRPVERRERVAALLLGADDTFAPPYDADEALARVRRLVARATAAPPAASALTNREREVLALLAEGARQSEIAARLFISAKTVSTHIQHILLKLGVHSRAEAVAVAYRDGIVPPQRTARAPS